MTTSYNCLEVELEIESAHLWRQELHERLDQILDKRIEIGAPPTANALGALLLQLEQRSGVDRSAALSLIFDVIDLARDVMGDTVIARGFPRRFRQEADQRHVLRNWLRILHPLIQPRTGPMQEDGEIRELSAFDVLDSISALDAGEVQPIFEPNRGKYRRANHWSLARAKLLALVWKKRLRSLGYEEKAANYEITLAFGEQWDTIRKWRTQSEKILGELPVKNDIEAAGSPLDPYMPKKSGMFGSSPSQPLAALKAAGESYREEARKAAELSKRKLRSVA